jgi:hypothetical protein
LYFPVDGGGGASWGAAARSLSEDQKRLPGGRLFRLRRLTFEKSKVAPSKSKQKCVLLAWFLLRRNPLTPVLHRGPAPNGHPCPDALAASMRLGPLHETCVQPAPKSRLAVSGLVVFEQQGQIKSFPAEAGPTCARGLLVGPALAGKRSAKAPTVLLIGPLPLGASLPANAVAVLFDLYA